MNINRLSLTSLLTIQLVLVSGIQNADEGGIIGIIINSILNLSSYLQRLFPIYPNTNSNEPFLDVNPYDFVIVGASPSGLALANRLSQNHNWKILILEAGGEPPQLTDVPILSSVLSFSNLNWGYRTQKQRDFCRGCIDGSLWYVHGKALGGSSIINYMIYTRGNKMDYDRWCQAGNPGWCYDDVFPYFLKSEDAHIKDMDKGYHHRGGLLNISDISFRSRSAEVWVEAAQQAGYSYVDYNGKQQIGVSYIQATKGYGRRWSAEKAYLRPIRKRKNLTIKTDALVVNVLIDSNTKSAYGVNYISKGKPHRVIAKKEIIISAGGLNSPKILMMSGVGPAGHLDDIGIPRIVDLPVGKLMYDHAIFPGMYFTLNESIGYQAIQYLINPKSYKDFILENKGPFTSIGAAETITFFRSIGSDGADTKYPNIEVLTIGMSLQSDYGIAFRRVVNVPKSIYDVVFKPREGRVTFTAFPILVHPKSKGFIKLKSKNFNDAPLYYANFLSDPLNQDVKAFIGAIREIQRIVASPAFKPYDITLVDTKIPGCEIHEFDSDSYWECALRTIIGSLWHQVGTCKMGPKDDPEAVVDHQLRVHGIKSLRVVDVSIIPLPITGHTVAPAYMIGEKAADIIRDLWKGR